MVNSLRIVFAGTPDFAAHHLAALLNSDHQVVAVFTQPDRPAGRGKKFTPSPVKILAQQHELALFQPVSLRDVQYQQQLAALQADVMVVVAYGLILPAAVLAIPRAGCINVHGSLLPRWRGAAPVQRALWAGDSQTGVSIMQMNSGLDCGDILCQLSCPIDPQDTSASLYHKLAQCGSQALLTTLEQLLQGHVMRQVQDETQACYAHKLTKQEARLDWNLSAAQLERCVRAFNPWPVSYLMINNEPLKIWQACVWDQPVQAVPAGTVIRADKHGIVVACADGALNLQRLQPAGKNPLSAADLLNSRKEWFSCGLCLS